MFSDLLFPIIYGLVIFLAGMKLMETALSKLAEPLLTTSLNRATSTPIKGMIASSLLSALLQSSTAVTVLTIGMVNAGLLTYARTLGIILGSNIGTTLTTELIGLQINTILHALAGSLAQSVGSGSYCRRTAAYIASGRALPQNIPATAIYQSGCIRLRPRPMGDRCHAVYRRNTSGKWLIPLVPKPCRYKCPMGARRWSVPNSPAP